MKLIAIVGMPGAGKSVAADFFRSKGMTVLRFGDLTDSGLQELGLERNEKNERLVREKLRNDLGMAAYAIKIEPRIRQAAKTSDRIILDGLRSWEEYVYLKKKFSELKLLCIYARPELRHERLAKRPVRPVGTEELMGRDMAEVENLNMGGPIAIADYLVENNDDEPSFLARLERFFSATV